MDVRSNAHHRWEALLCYSFLLTAFSSKLHFYSFLFHFHLVPNTKLDGYQFGSSTLHLQRSRRGDPPVGLDLEPLGGIMGWLLPALPSPLLQVLRPLSCIKPRNMCKKSRLYLAKDN